MRDAKSVHEERLQRDDLDYQRGWSVEPGITGFLWGMVFVIAVMVFWP